VSIETLPATLQRELGIILPLGKVIHIGANMGQEVARYERAGVEGYHVEAHPAYFKRVRKLCAATAGQTAVQACCSDASGEAVEFNVTNNTQSSSMLPLGRHALAYPTIVVTEKIRLITTTVDDLIEAHRLPADPDFLLIDVQGAEAKVLSGAQGLLRSGALWGVLVEVSLDPLYEGGSDFDEVYTRFMKPNGYFLKSAEFNRQGWTDALFLKRWWVLPEEEFSPLHRATRWVPDEQGRNIGPIGHCTQSSTSRWSRSFDEAVNAVKGLPSGCYAFHTELEENAWWMIEWESPQRIDEIVCYNRLDGAAASERVKGLLVEFSPDGEEWQPLHEVDQVFGGVQGAPLRVNADSVLAKGVRLRQPSRSYLHLDHLRFLQR
jgi:FkbM family methyltransferase